MTKEKFVEEKHHISYFRVWLVRLIGLIVIFTLFMVLPDTLIEIYKMIGFKEETVRKHFREFDFIISKIIIIMITILSHISIKVKHCCNILLCLSVIIIFIIFMVKEMILIV
jgi:hypothetical protein